MPTREQITRHDPPPAPLGADPWVAGAAPERGIEIVEPNEAWPASYDVLAERIRDVLGWRVLALDHVGSTSVPGLPAKPIIDVVLVVADPEQERVWLPGLVQAGFVHRVREPWWWGHRLLRHDAPRCHLHVFGPDSPEPIRLRLFRDWLRAHPGQVAHYAGAKREAAAAANAAGEHMMDYNARKQAVIREIYDRAFRAAGLLDA